MPNSKTALLTTIKIDRFSSKGNGIGQFERNEDVSIEADVSFAIPGDLVQVALIGKNQGQWKGHIKEVIKPAPERRAPKCSHFGTCGGCRWQQLSYENQLKLKESIVRENFADILSPSVDIRPIMGCDAPWEYRNKMEFSFSMDINKKKYLGLVKDFSKGKVLNLSECHLVHPWFMNVVKAVQRWWEETDLPAYRLSHNTGILRTLTLREGTNTGDRMVILTVSQNNDLAFNKNFKDSFILALQEAMESPDIVLSIVLRVQHAEMGMTTNFFEMRLHGPDYINEKLNIIIDPTKKPESFIFKISPSVFFQPNTKQTERFYSKALQLAGINENTVIYDLYCGTGTLGICAARTAKCVVGIEISSEAAQDAKHNAACNDCQNVTIFAGAVRHILAQDRVFESLPSPDVVFIDPPRAGLDKVALSNLLGLGAKTILYISCNLNTQVTDVTQLLQNGYRIKVIQPVDQFPQTIHIENIVLLEKI